MRKFYTRVPGRVEIMKTLDTTRGQMLAQAKRRVKTMRTIEEIKAELIQAELCHASMKAHGMYRTDIPAEEQALHRLSELRAEFFVTVANGIEFNRLEEICNAERDGRCAVLPKVPKSDKDLMSAYLKEHFDDAGLYGMTEGEAKLANAILAALGNPEEAEATLRKEQGDER